MFYGYFGCAVCLVAIFSIPADMSDFSKYAWFFITYTVLNAGFYTANNIAYSALTALITKNNHERVQMGSIRFMFAFGTSMLIQTITVAWVNSLGGDAAAWRTVAIIYAIIGVISNTISVFSVKELSPEEKALLIAENPAYGRVICRCETITEAEILHAIHSEVPATTIDGVKRRCNAGMGRCQGGFCGPRVLELLSRELGISPMEVLQDKAGTNVLVQETKIGGKNHD